MQAIWTTKFAVASKGTTATLNLQPKHIRSTAVIYFLIILRRQAFLKAECPPVAIAYITIIYKDKNGSNMSTLHVLHNLDAVRLLLACWTGQAKGITPLQVYKVVMPLKTPEISELLSPRTGAEGSWRSEKQQREASSYMTCMTLSYLDIALHQTDVLFWVSRRPG